MSVSPPDLRSTAEDRQRSIRPLCDDELAAASALLAHAAIPRSAGAQALWSPAEIDLARCQEWQQRGELFGGFEDVELAAVFCLCASDPELWPEARPDEALYLHKLAVRQSSRGTGWTATVIAWAAARAKREQRNYLRLDTVERSHAAGER